jgi:hypothetical protein
MTQMDADLATVSASALISVNLRLPCLPDPWEPSETVGFETYVHYTNRRA